MSVYELEQNSQQQELTRTETLKQKFTLVLPYVFPEKFQNFGQKHRGDQGDFFRILKFFQKMNKLALQAQNFCDN